MSDHPPGFERLDEFSYHQRLARVPGIALVMFATEHCRSCRAWRRLLSDYCHRHRDAPALFDVDVGHSQGLAREFELFHLPALFLYRDGRYHGPLQCEAEPRKLHAALAAALAAPALEPP